MIDTISISIIVPAYNVQRYIEECVVSICGQMHCHHELIVVNDGSSDATPALLRQLQRRFHSINFTVYDQPNLGVAHARNQGVALARGDYIAFVDSDDVLRPGSLIAIDRVIRQHQPDAVACDLNIWHPERSGKDQLVRAGYVPDVLIDDSDTILNVFFRDRQMYVWSKIFKRDIYEQQSLPLFPPDRIFEDVTLVPKLLHSCANLYYLPYCTIDYRQRPASITKVISEKSCIDLATALLPARALIASADGQPSVRLSYDVAVSYIYLGIVKDSYQLPLASGRAVRRRLKTIFVEGLFNDWQTVLKLLEDEFFRGGSDAMGLKPARPIKFIKQVRQAMSGSMLFRLRQASSRRWRRMHGQIAAQFGSRI